LDDIYEAYADLKSKTDLIIFESSVIGEIDEDKQLVLESENKNFIEKIGEKIIEMSKKFMEMIDRLIDKVKSIGFKFKSNEKKMDLLLKQHPELAKEKIQVLCDEGGLDFSDMKSLSELDKEFEAILKMSKEKDIDPNTLKGKWEKAKKKWVGTDSDKATNVKKVAAAATAVITLGVAIHKFKPEITTWKNKLSEAKMHQKSENYKFYKHITEENPEMADKGVIAWKLAMNRERNGLYSKAIQKHQSIFDRMINSIADGIDKVIGSKPGKVVFGDAKSSYIDDMKQASKMEKKKTHDEEYRRRKATRKADLEFDKKHQDDFDTITKKNKTAARQADLEFDKKHQDDFDTITKKNKTAARQADLEFDSDYENQKVLNQLEEDRSEASERGKINASIKDRESKKRRNKEDAIEKFRNTELARAEFIGYLEQNPEVAERYHKSNDYLRAIKREYDAIVNGSSNSNKSGGKS
jgi:hypothetical protein